ncbi:hypothetical protein PG994_013868 [Apiospora phragmitis]|uniref:Alpha-type protein kinase domain-containing protein n=1 Tax=Apiospora phragmitis TaxID=2905665 RepID=A0ABR1T2P5_9PEZI
MMAHDDNIKSNVVQHLTIQTRSMPFGQGAMRTASYARTEAGKDRFVVKAFKKSGIKIAHLAEDMRIQALCKAFALEFNALVGKRYSIDFMVTAALQVESSSTYAKSGCISLEPFIQGLCQVQQQPPGYFLINDLQGVGGILTDPTVQTADSERFKLSDNNLVVESMKIFSVHECNPYAERWS